MTVPTRTDPFHTSTEYVRPTPTIHGLRTSIQHWQLRDLITCGSNGDLLSVNQTAVQSYNTKSHQTTTVLQDLAFSPTSITAGHGFLAVGGQRSQVVIRSLVDPSWMAQTNIGGAINNAIHITRHSSGCTRLLVCNNDESIKIFAVPSMDHITTIKFPAAVNNASTSPDGRYLAAVGDSNQISVFGADGADHYSPIHKVANSNDACFSCAWNDSSTMLAVASQDGFVNVWDARKMSDKVASIPAIQRGQKGACRTVKFTRSNSMDLLAFAEHVSQFSVVDTRSFTSRQAIRPCPQGMDVHISGLTFSPDSQSLFVSTEAQCLEYSVNSVVRRMFPEHSFA